MIVDDDLSGLDPHARLRYEHRGKWIAWTPGFGRFLTAHEDREAARAAALEAGCQEPLLEWSSNIPNALTRQAIRDAREGKNLIHYASMAEFFESLDRGFPDNKESDDGQREA